MAVVNTDGPKLSKRRKLGKNKKKAWRASNVQDIQDFLDDERRQKHLGGLVAEKSDEVLFVVDTGKAEDKTSDTVLTRKGRGKKALKCHALLQPDPHSHSVRKPEASDFKKGKRTVRILDRLRARAQTEKRVSAEFQKTVSILERENRRAEKRKLPEVTSDLWADTESSGKVKPPKKYRIKPSALSATVIPHPGASANPSYEDHQDLLKTAVTVEKKKVKEEKRISNALDKMFPTQANAPDEKSYLAEMSAGLIDDSDEEEQGENEEENSSLSVNPPVRRENKKTKKQRRIQEKLAEEAKEKEKVKDLRRRENMVLRIRSLKSEIHKEEIMRKEKEAQKKKLKEQEPFKTKRLGSVRYQEPDLDLKLSTELVGSLREMKPEGHLLNDMYSSLCRRNVIEPRVQQKRKRTYKRKVFERKGHKAVTL